MDPEQFEALMARLSSIDVWLGIVALLLGVLVGLTLGEVFTR